MMAHEQLPIGAVEVHAVALAVTKQLALGALALTRPLAIAVGPETVLPDVHEAVAIDVALVIVGPDAGATRDGAVGQDGGGGDAGRALVEVVADVHLVAA